MWRRSSLLLSRLAAAAARSSEASACLAQETALGHASSASCSARCFSTNSHDHFNIHRDGPDNTLDTKFDFSAEGYEIAAELLTHYPSNYKASAVIPLLDLAQKENGGWLSLAAMNKVAEVLEMAPIRVYEVATFYTMFNRTKMGRFHVMVCGTTPCMLCGARNIYEAIKTHLGVDYGETTQDGWFTFSEMECMGSCVNAPMIAIADYREGLGSFSYNYYEDLTPAKAVQILDDLKAGKQPRLGSQFRNKAEPRGSVSSGEWKPKEQGAMTLTFEATGGKPPGPFCRNLDEPPPEAKEEGAKPGPTPPPPPKTPPPPKEAPRG